ncbi:MAG TPA: acyl-CoA dehydrogenase family protein [Stellaceae bacterium]
MSAKIEPQRKREPHAPDAAEMIAAARDLVPYLRARAAQCEAERRISDATIAKLHAAGLFKLVKPRRYGGYELGWNVFSEAVIAIASGCGSTGWVYSVVGGHAPVVARFGTKFLDEFWGENPETLASSCRHSAGSVARAAGGYRGSGVGVYSSGCLNAQWVIVEGIPVDGESRTITAVLPRADIEILDTWKVIGLAGTGSHDLRYQDIFIPDHRTWFPGKAPAGEALDGPLFRTPYLGGPFALPSVVIGIAIAGLEHFAGMTYRRSSRQGGGAAEQQSMQMRLGEAAIEVDAALALLRVKLKEMMAVLSGGTFDQSGERAVLPPGGVAHRYDQAASGFIAHAGYQALNRLMEAAGAGQLAVSEPFQRCFRDALAGTQQPSTNWDNGRTMGGRELLDRFKPRPG